MDTLPAPASSLQDPSPPLLQGSVQVQPAPEQTVKTIMVDYTISLLPPSAPTTPSASPIHTFGPYNHIAGHAGAVPGAPANQKPLGHKIWSVRK